MAFPVNTISTYGLWAGRHSDIIKCLLKGQLCLLFSITCQFPCLGEIEIGAGSGVWGNPRLLGRRATLSEPQDSTLQSCPKPWCGAFLSLENFGLEKMRSALIAYQFPIQPLYTLCLRKKCLWSKCQGRRQAWRGHTGKQGCNLNKILPIFMLESSPICDTRFKNGLSIVLWKGTRK